MEKDIDIAKLLKNCAGTKLYSKLAGDCTLAGVVYNDTISIVSGDERCWHLDKYGKVTPNGECQIFPSKEIMDWNLFQVKFIKMTGIKETDDNLKHLLDIDKSHLNDVEYLPDTILYRGRLDNEVYSNRKNDEEYHFILSTGTELKQEEKGIFHVGDLVNVPEANVMGIITSIQGDDYTLDLGNEFIITHSMYLTTPTSEEINDWNKTILEPDHLHYSVKKKKYTHWFLPFDRVLTRRKVPDEYLVDSDDRDFYDHTWIATFFSHCDGDRYVTTDGDYCVNCVPYTEELNKYIGTTLDLPIEDT